jgi:hypothetical protein
VHSPPRFALLLLVAPASADEGTGTDHAVDQRRLGRSLVDGHHLKSEQVEVDVLELGVECDQGLHVLGPDLLRDPDGDAGVVGRDVGEQLAEVVVVARPELRLDAGRVPRARVRNDVDPEAPRLLLDLAFGEGPLWAQGRVENAEVACQPGVEMSCFTGPQVVGGPPLQVSDLHDPPSFSWAIV